MSSGLLAAARTLALAEHARLLSESLEAAGVPVVLLKGGVTAAWLYSNGQRTYRDVDLLVRPRDRRAARAVLDDLGVVDGHPGNLYRSDNEEHLFLPNGLCVDLHWRLVGVPSGYAEEAAELLFASHRPFLLNGATLRRLGDVDLLVHAALHVAQSARDDKALLELNVALRRAELPEWQAALLRSRQLHCEPAFAAGLGRSAEGAAVARALGATHALTPELVLRRWGSRQEALAWHRLFCQAQGTRAAFLLSWFTFDSPERHPLLARARLAAIALRGIPAYTAAGVVAWAASRRSCRKQAQPERRAGLHPDEAG